MTERWLLMADALEDGSRRSRDYLLSESGEPSYDAKMRRAWGEPPMSPITWMPYPSWDDVPPEERPAEGFGGEWWGPLDPALGLIGGDWTWVPDESGDPWTPENPVGEWYPPQWRP